MSRPLLITDCDEVLLHMVVPFRGWLDEAHGVDFRLAADFSGALTRRACGTTLRPTEVWPLLDGFFATEMPRQQPVRGAVDAIAALANQADVVVLTNLTDACHARRVAQLSDHGIRHRVVCNQGGKGPAVRRLVDELSPNVVVFVDDLPQHHESVAADVPGVWRLHMVAEPEMAPLVPAAAHAHARIDDWPAARRWIGERFAAGADADA